MHHRILNALRPLKQDLAGPLDRPAIRDACRAAGHTGRECPLDPVAVVPLVLTQVLHGHAALTHVPRLVGLTVTASASGQARARLPLAVFQEALRRVGSALRPEANDGRWHGHRTLLVDGSRFAMPDTPEFRAPFGLSARTRPGGGFPGARLMALFHAGTGRLLEAFAVPRAGHDRAWASRLHPRREAGDVLVGDRGFCSFAHLALLVPKGRHGLFRMHQRPIVDFTPGRPHVDRRRKDTAAGRPRSRGVRALGGTDPVVEGFRPNEAPSGLCAKQDAALPGSLLVRARRYRTEVPGFRTRVVTRATTRLEGAVYPAADLATLSFRRWALERHLRELKQTRGRDVRRCQSVAGVTKELTVDCLASNLVRATMREAARRQDVSGDRVSFVDARRWLACTQAGEPLPELVVNPHRPGRFEPRSTKRRPKAYPWLTVLRHELRKRLLRQADAA